MTHIIQILVILSAAKNPSYTTLVILSVAKNPGQVNKHFSKSPYQMDKKGFTYILASKKNGTLYIGVTSNLEKRIYEHKSESIEGFTKKYHVHDLVRYQGFPTIIEAIEQEKH